MKYIGNNIYFFYSSIFIYLILNFVEKLLYNFSNITYLSFTVTQVSGELSNAGQPMRRFTQTFVLAVQAPKTYYVHNDIFRYQDLIFPDEDEADVSGADGGESGERETEEIGRTEPEEDEHQTQPQQLSTPAQAAEQQAQPPLIPTQQPPIQQQQPMYYNVAAPQPHVSYNNCDVLLKHES